MFTAEQIKQVHSKVKSGADFPNYVQDLIGLGIKNYESFVIDGHSVFFGEGDYSVQLAYKYDAVSIAENSDSEKFIHYLKIHQAGQTDYLTFCNHCAEAGIEKWKVDLSAMTCTYFDLAGETILVEKIPS